MILEAAKISFNEERYDEAEAFLKEADLKLDEASSEAKRLKGLINLSKGFFVKYWWAILLFIILVIVFGPKVAKKVRVKLAKNKLLNLRLELQTLERLIKKAQEDRFKFKKLTKVTYDIRINRYKDRMTEIKHTIPVLESIIGKKVKKKVKKRGVLEIK
ncbi:hypothetical protein CL618_00580 [archaeon]|nr:hypothetical protein [archaeon]